MAVSMAARWGAGHRVFPHPRSAGPRWVAPLPYFGAEWVFARAASTAVRTCRLTPTLLVPPGATCIHVFTRSYEAVVLNQGCFCHPRDTWCCVMAFVADTAREQRCFHGTGILQHMRQLPLPP